MTKLYLCNVSQAYVQSTLDLNQDFFIRPFPELITMIGASPECILKVVKPLHVVPEAENHWFATYHNYHVNIFAVMEKKAIKTAKFMTK